MNVQAPMVSEDREKAVKILAKSLYKELTVKGYGTQQIVALSSELLRLITSSYHEGDEAPKP